MKRYAASLLAFGLAIPALPLQAQETTTPPLVVPADACADGRMNAIGQCEQQSDDSGGGTSDLASDPNKPSSGESVVGDDDPGSVTEVGDVNAGGSD